MRSAALSCLFSMVVLAACGGGEGGPGEASVPALSPQEASAEFRGICRSIRESDEPYYGLKQIEELRGYL